MWVPVCFSEYFIFHLLSCNSIYVYLGGSTIGYNGMESSRLDVLGKLPPPHIPPLPAVRLYLPGAALYCPSLAAGSAVPHLYLI